MSFVFASIDRKGSLLAHYTQRMGALVDRRLSQVALEAARKEAELSARNAVAASRAKSEFLANMSHELHTPLSSIIGFAEMMEREVKGAMPPVYRDYAKNILDSGRQLLAVVDDVLDLSQIETGTYAIAETEIDIAEALTGIFRLAQGRAAQAGLYLQARMPTGLPRLTADARAFKQIVSNLLSNAIKYTRAGGRIYVLASLTPERELSLRVVDTGVGMKESELARIVLPFERLGEAMTRKQQGAGLGLTLVDTLMRMHGGTLVLQSKVGVGTMATVTFPARRLAAAAPADNAPADTASAETGPGDTSPADIVPSAAHDADTNAAPQP